ncbi:MAG: hypothetical protein ABJD68_06460, partial [Nakamurella sp.]
MSAMWEPPTRARKSAETSSAHAIDPSPLNLPHRSSLTDGKIDQCFTEQGDSNQSDSNQSDSNQSDGWRMDYAATTDRLLASYLAIPPTATVRLA